MSDTVLIGGVFDPLHAGHLAYIREAQKYGRLRVALSDAPDKHPPLVPIGDRARLLMALGAADVFCVSPGHLGGLLADIKPSAYIKGKDWEGRLPQEEIDTCAEFGIEIVYVDTVTQSSSRLLAEYTRHCNAEQLAQFEMFIANQEPAREPWQPVTDYSRETRRQIEAPQADILAEVCAGCSVLDYGCGFGYLVELLRERGMDAVGWDPAHAPDAPRQPADLVICREVLEHLTVRQIVGAVRELVARARRFIYVTTRFTDQAHLLAVDRSDALDPTHITLLNQGFLRTLFVLEGCRRRADLEVRLDWQRKGRVLVYEVPA